MKPLLLFFVTALFSQAYAIGFPTPSDVDYKVVENEDYHFIFPEEQAELASMVISLNEDLKKYYQKSYNWTLDERTSLVLASDFNQEANAFATMIPNSLTVFFSGGASLYDRFAFNSWLTGLLVHETAHLYQLNPKRDLAKVSKMIFGNNLVFVLPLPIPLPVVTFPNAINPTWITEGNATFNEATFGNGGRLYSGEYKAMFYNLMQAGVLDPTRVTNNVLRFPFGTEKYIVGAYVNLAMAKRYGINKVNEFFYNHANHYFIPFRLSETYIRTFGRDYKTVINESLAAYLPGAKAFRKSSQKAMVSSFSNAGFGRGKDSILFLSQETGRKEPVLHVFDNNGELRESRPLFVPFGRPFEVRGKYYTASNQIIDLNRNVYSLWGDGLDRLEEWDSHLVSDARVGKVASFFIPESFDRPMLMINGKKQGNAHSSAIFDNQGNGYWFIQDKKKRTLVKNGKALFSLESYYGRPVDVDAQGRVYFISNSKWGSGLFRYSKNSFERIGESDAIVDARILKSGGFLVVEITENGYEVKKINPVINKGDPHVLKYFFETEESFAFIDKVSSARSAAVRSKLDMDDYNSLTAWRFNNWTFSFYGTEDDWGGSAQVNFSDAMQFNFLTLSYFHDTEDDERIGRLIYSNRRFLLNWDLILGWRERNTDSDFTKPAPIDEKSGMVLLSRQIARFSDWNYFLKYGVGGKDDSKHVTTEHYGNFSIERNRNFFLSYYPTRIDRLEFEYLSEREGGTGAFRWEFGRELFHDLHLHTSLNYAYTSSDEIDVGAPLLNFYDSLVPQEGYLFDLRSGSAHGGRFGLALKKVLDTPLYSRWFPLGLRRLAPVAFGNFHQVQAGNTLERYEYGGGLDMELLLAHLAPFRFQIYYSEQRDQQNEKILRMNFGGAF